MRGALLAVLSIAFAGDAAAAAVTFDFGGTISWASPQLTGTFASGQPIVGSITIESTTANTQPAPGLGYFPGAIVAASFTIGSLAYTATGNVQVRDNWNGPLDQYLFLLYPIGPSVAGYNPSVLQVSLSNSSNPAAIVGDGLPGAGLTLSGFSGGFDFSLNAGGPNVSTYGELQSFSAAPVPLPAAAWLLLSGLGGLGLVARRKAA